CVIYAVQHYSISYIFLSSNSKERLEIQQGRETQKALIRKKAFVENVFKESKKSFKFHHLQSI
mgnify:CR=1